MDFTGSTYSAKCESINVFLVQKVYMMRVKEKVTSVDGGGLDGKQE